MPTTAPAPVTLVLGDEDLLADRAVRAAVRQATAALGKGTAVEQVAGKALPDGFAMGLATPSLFGGGRIVVIDDAQELDAEARNVVLSLAENPGDGTVLVLRAPGVGRQSKFFTAVQKHAELVKVPKLKPAERRSWAQAEFRAHKRKIDARALAALLDLVGGDLRELAGAVAKLHVAVAPPAPITDADVAEHLTPSAERGVFDLTKAVFAGDAPGALTVLDALRVQGEQPMGLLAILARQVRQLVQVGAYEGMSSSRIAQLVGGTMRDWQVDQAKRQAGRYRPEQLRDALVLLGEADAKIRTGAAEPWLLLETIVTRLAVA